MQNNSQQQCDCLGRLCHCRTWRTSCTEGIDNSALNVEIKSNNNRIHLNSRLSIGGERRFSTTMSKGKDRKQDTEVKRVCVHIAHVSLTTIWKSRCWLQQTGTTERETQASGHERTYFTIFWDVSVRLSGTPKFLISPLTTVLTLLWGFSGRPCWQAAIRLAQVSTRECYTRAPGAVSLWMRPPSPKCWNLWATPLLLWGSGTLGSEQTGPFFPQGRGLTSTSASLTPTTWWAMKSWSVLTRQFK